MNNFTPYPLTESEVKKLAIWDAVSSFNLGADKTQTDEQLLDWESTQAFIRGVRTGYGLGSGVKVWKPWYMRLWDKI